MREFCKIVWTWQDVQANAGAEHWTQEQCEQFLERHEQAIRESMVFAGLEEIASLVDRP